LGDDEVGGEDQGNNWQNSGAVGGGYRSSMYRSSMNNGMGGNRRTGRFSRAATSVLLVSGTAFVYTIARASFKGVVDASGPYRLSTGVIILVAQVIFTAFILLTKVQQERAEIIKNKKKQSKRNATPPSAIPPYQQYQLPPRLPMVISAAFDATAIALLLLSAEYVPPVLTVLLLQVEVPVGVALAMVKGGSIVATIKRCLCCCCCFYGAMGGVGSRGEGDGESVGLLNPVEAENGVQQQQVSVAKSINENDNSVANINGGGSSSNSQNDLEAKPAKWNGYKSSHLVGAVIVMVSLLMGVAPAVHAIYYKSDSDEVFRESVNTMIFLGAGCLSAISTMFKEDMLIKFAKPVDPHYLTVSLTSLEILILLLISPLLYPLQSFGSGDVDNPFQAEKIFANVGRAWSCLVDQVPVTTDYDVDDKTGAHCVFVAPLVVLHVIGLIGVSGAIHIILGWGGGIKVRKRQTKLAKGYGRRRR